MKSRFLILWAMAAMTMLPMAGETLKFSSFRQGPSYTVTLPAEPDSLATGQKRYDASRLLDQKKAADRFHRYQTADWTTLLPDTAGFVDLKAPAKATSQRPQAVVHTLTTRLRPERFVKGTLKAESTARLEVFVNGKSQIKKTAADSLPSSATASLTLAPAEEADIEIHVLAMSDDKSTPRLALSFEPDKDFTDVAIAEGPLLERRFNIELTTLGARLTSTALSPDGRYILLNFRETYSSKAVRAWTELRETSSGRVLSEEISAGARWMPRGATLYATRKTSDGHTLFTIDPATMHRSVLSESQPCDAGEIVWAPDGKSFFYYASEDGKKETGVMKRVTSPDDHIPGNRDRRYIMQHLLESGISRQLTYGGESTDLGEVSPDSRRILYTVTRQTPDKFPFYTADVIQMNLTTLATDTLIRETGFLNGACYSPDGKRLLVWGGPSIFNEVGKNCGSHPIANDFDIQAYIFDIASRKVTPLTRDFDPSIQGVPVWNRADGKIYFTAAEGFYGTVYRLDPDRKTFTKLPVKTDYVRNFSIGEYEGKWLAYTGMSNDYQGRGYLLDLRNGRNTLLADPLDMSEVAVGKTEPWSFTAADGTVIDGAITLPPDFDPSKKYPMIVYYYAGTTPVMRNSHSPYAPNLFASRGYVCYTLNPSGTIGYGQEYSARHVNAWGDGTADEIIAGVKELCRTHPYINEKKIGCIGASYGGFMTQLLQTRTDIFAAAVSHAGISNVASYWGEGYWGYSYNSAAAAKSYPWSNPEVFTKNSSLFNADKIHTPLLLLHGTVDTNVPIGESIQLFNALRILGRDVEFITVEDQNHVITDYDKRCLWHATIMAWFAKWLQDDPRWWDSLYK